MRIFVFMNLLGELFTINFFDDRLITAQYVDDIEEVIDADKAMMLKLTSIEMGEL